MRIIVPTMILDFLIPFGVLMAVVFIAGILISSGVNLLYGDIGKIMSKLSRLESSIRAGTETKGPTNEEMNVLEALKDQVKKLKEKRKR